MKIWDLGLTFSFFTKYNKNLQRNSLQKENTEQLL